MNRADAEWCGQCHVRFELPESVAPEVAPPEVVEPSDPVHEAVPQEISSWDPLTEPATEVWDSLEGPVADVHPIRPDEASTEMTVADDPLDDIEVPPEAVGIERGAFKVAEDGIVWTCRMCDTENEMSASLCAVCGTTFSQTLIPPVERPLRDPNSAALWSLFLPGAGHAYLGLWGQAIARAVVSLWVWLVVFVAAVQRGAAGSNAIMVVFGVAAFGLWFVGAHDAYREARHEDHQVILKGRLFLYLVLGLLALLMFMLMASFLKARG